MDTSSQSKPPTVAVVGALGLQGASVVAALLSSPLTAHWHVRALTSSPDSAAAKALVAKPNVSIVRCDANDFASVCAAFHDCTHIFAGTAFHGQTLLSKGPEAAEKLERVQAANLVRAAAATETLEHLVFSTLPDSGLTSNRKWHIPHFASKQGANAFILGGYPGDGLDDAAREEGWGSLRNKISLLCIGMYGSNLIWDPYRPRRKVCASIWPSNLERLTLRAGTSDEYVIRMPCSADAPFAVAGDVKTNVGLTVHAIFEQPSLTRGVWVACVAEVVSFRQWVGALGAAAKAQGLSGSIVFEECSLEAFEMQFGDMGTETGVMLQYYHDERERSFENTSGLPEVSLRELGVEKAMVSSRNLYDRTDLKALLNSGDDEAPRYGTLGLVRE